MFAPDSSTSTEGSIINQVFDPKCGTIATFIGTTRFHLKVAQLTSFLTFRQG
ncbi:hypothetical protein GYMLUDRAFT_675282 [Collybiopsis luxurians FD-317 M1]|uniref:Uncharacterized protein n=1 Tax=Collybiopsis luxurians FD-317 M1 TaxID=944289 RepID=A0A0D0B719_9AGAR|nr:hypothetical protein GYMLUDRAFT_675282 [Collybiopsis luxurians FD-317 M1]